MITVKLPDGSVAQFPDGTPNDIMKAAIAKKFGPTGQVAGAAANAGSAEPPPPRPDLMSSTLATVNGAVASVPFLQQTTDALGGVVSQLTGGNYNDYVKHQQDVRAQLARQAPVARFMGELGGNVAGVGALGATKLGAEALGLSGGFGKQLANSALSQAGISGLQGLSQGHTGGQLLADEGLGLGAGALGSVVGQGIAKGGQAIADTVTNAAQRKATSQAIVGAPTASELKSVASDLFDAATGSTPVMVNDNAYFRFLGNVKQVADKFRINAQNDPQSVGLLETLMRIADDTSNGVAVDLKDLHLIRQLAGKVAQSNNGRDKAFGTLVIGQMDDFVRSLKSSDILGGADPKAASNALLTGISTWSRANKVAAVEDAIKNADTYKSGFENGLKLSFLKLIKDPIFDRFNEAEKRAIREVAKGTGKQNIASLIGAFGINLTGSAGKNIIGAGAGTTALTTLLSPILGPAALPAAATITTGAGMAGRAAAEAAAKESAARAVGAVATPGLPIIPQMANPLLPSRVPVDLLIRAGLGSMVSP